MPDLDLPSPYPLLASSPLDGLSELFYKHDAPQDSLAIVNGFLDKDNFASAFELESIHVQRGAMVDAWSSSGNANLDYKPSAMGVSSFSGHAGYGEPPNLSRAEALYIPGANRTFYMPWDGPVLALWSVYMNAHCRTEKVHGVVFHVDGTPHWDSYRKITFTTVTDSTANVLDNYVGNAGYLKSRSFSGHYVSAAGADLSAGWHTAGLRLLIEEGSGITRLHACDVCVVALKR